MKIPRRGILAAAMSLALAAGACASTRDRRADLPAGLSGIGELPPPASAWPAAGFDARHSSATGATGPLTAHVRWARELDGNVTPGPVIGADGTIIVATNAGVLHSLDPHSGADVWTFDGMGATASTCPRVRRCCAAARSCGRVRTTCCSR